MQRNLLIDRLAIWAALIRLQRVAKPAILILVGAQGGANWLGRGALEQMANCRRSSSRAFDQMNSSARSKIVGSDIVPPYCTFCRIYAVGALGVWQSGTLCFNDVRFSAIRAENRTQEDRQAPCCRRQKQSVVMRDDATA